MKTVEQIRRERLQALIDQHGGVKAFADAISRAPSQVSQWKNASKDGKDGKARSMSGRAARQIESTLKLQPGWMDQPIDISQQQDHKVISLKERRGDYQDANVAEAVRLMLDAPPEVRFGCVTAIQQAIKLHGEIIGTAKKGRRR